jgi:hypothetical protein
VDPPEFVHEPGVAAGEQFLGQRPRPGRHRRPSVTVRRD